MLTSARLRLARAAALGAAAALAISFSLPAAAARTDARPVTPDAAARTNVATPDPDRMICVRAQLTGSRLNRRICRTQREWEEDGGVPTAR